MFSVHTTLERFENTTVTNHFGVVFDDNNLKCVLSTLNSDRKPAFSNSSGLNSVFEELRFRDGLIGNLSIDDERRDDDVRYPRRIGSSKQWVVRVLVL